MNATKLKIENGNASLMVKEDFGIMASRGQTHVAEGQVVLRNARKDLFTVVPGSFSAYESEQVQDKFGQGERIAAGGQFITPAGDQLQVELSIRSYKHWQEAFLCQWSFTNTGDLPMQLTQIDCPALRLNDAWTGQEKTLWTFQGVALEWGQDFAFPLPGRFYRSNQFTHRDDGEGGGIPLVDIWNGEIGLALAYIESQPKLWCLPVSRDQYAGTSLALQERRAQTLQPGQKSESLQTMIVLHSGDFYAPLSLYREMLSALGIQPAQPVKQDYDPAWCSWGYEFDVRPDEVIGVLPALAELGIRWLMLDDRWFDNYGDWNPRVDTFPGGEKQMRHMVDQIHDQGGYAQIWWYPLAVEDGLGGYDSHPYRISEILHQHPDWLCMNADGSVARNNRGLAVLDPSLPEVQKYIRELTLRFIHEWDFDGHKLDNIYTVPLCYNPAHHHKRPEESLEAMADVYRIIFETTRSLKPYSVTQICSCATPPLFTLLPAMDQAVTADPISSQQIRQRIKFYKALLGPRAAVFADHVELSDGGADFASEIGPGGVPGTKFTWPEDENLRNRLSEWWGLSEAKKADWQCWLELYDELRLSEGEYLNLYDLGFDLPEGHVICKGEKMYYAFYTPEAGQRWEGCLQLRGLEAGSFCVRDMISGRSLGLVEGPSAELWVYFESYLLLEVGKEECKDK